MRVLILDLENSPPVSEFWGDPWNPSIQPVFLHDPGKILMVGWKWLGERTTHVAGGPDVPQLTMLKEVWELLNEADVVVTYNGDRHDLPKINTEFFMNRMGPPSPYVSVDLYKTIKRRFKFIWGKLDFVAQQLGIGQKIKHQGHEMWQKVMAGDVKAWAMMIRYCKGDVRLTEKLHDEALAWIMVYPNRHLYGQQKVAKNGNPTCTRCGAQTTKQGTRKAQTRTYHQYLCDNGHWNRSLKSIPGEGAEAS